ncbi:hypothetical protein E1I69_14365 [Bacillus timonensis]|uniref:Uncharacterized protein n=1 Tax=Bacillus timonensis TaxID=1033734 RepID=A0A4S3PPS9_9BACI|nr:hypothetical protein [Bacillus timonensis]THE11631.1 hypothetical protein E1I69_14365 [Bacillus timonensis]
MKKTTYEDRVIYLVIGICMAIFAPISILFVPQTVAEIVHYKPDIWQIFVPKNIFYIYGVGYLLLILSMMFLFLLNNRKVSISLGIICVILSLVPFFVASQANTSLSYNSISHTPPLKLQSHTYKWDEIEKINYYKNEDEVEINEYEMFFRDGKSIKLPDNGYFDDIKLVFYSKLDEMNLEITEIE